MTHSRCKALLGLLLAVFLLLSTGAHGTLISGDQDALRAIASAYPMLQIGSNAWSASDAQQACVGPWRGVVCEPTLAPTQRVVQLCVLCLCRSPTVDSGNARCLL